MTDTIIKNAGNSRSIRSVPNLAILAPTWEKALEMLTRAEGLPIDLGPLNPLGVDVMGTPLDQAHLYAKEDGSYVGTSSSLLTLTFNVLPKFVVIFGGRVTDSYGYPTVIFIDVEHMIYVSIYGNAPNANSVVRSVFRVNDTTISISGSINREVANEREGVYRYIGLW